MTPQLPIPAIPSPWIQDSIAAAEGPSPVPTCGECAIYKSTKHRPAPSDCYPRCGPAVSFLHCTYSFNTTAHLAAQGPRELHLVPRAFRRFPRHDKLGSGDPVGGQVPGISPCEQHHDRRRAPRFGFALHALLP